MEIISDDVEQNYGRLLDALWRKGFKLDEGGIEGKPTEMASDDEFAAFQIRMNAIREGLNAVKAKVHAMVLSNTGKYGGAIEDDPSHLEQQLGRWRSFTSFTHPLRQLPHRLAAKCTEEGRSIPLCTQAYCKFLQIAIAHPKLISSVEENENAGKGEPLSKKLHSVDLNGNNDGKKKNKWRKFRSLHLCEAPGAFVLALKHLLAEKSIELDWRMNSLISQPSSSTNDDNHSSSPSNSANFFDQSLCQANPQRMALGPDGSGDIFHWTRKYSEAIIAQQGGAKFDLITGDGAIDCTNEPKDQESRMRPLIQRQFQIATECLRNDGNFLLKIYTFFEAQTVGLLATICAHYQQVHCLKPPSSKPGNSEIYLLCLNFRGKQLEEKCTAKLRNKSFLQRVEYCAQFFATHQAQFIQFNLGTFRRLSQSERTKLEMQKCPAQNVMVNFLWQQIERGLLANENDLEEEMED